MATVLFQTPPDAPRWKRLLLLSPLARIVLYAVITAVLAFAVAGLLKLSGFAMRDVAPFARQLLRFAVQIGCTLGAYLLLVRWIERRRPVELGLRRAIPDTFAGIAAGVALISAVIAVMWMAGAYRVERTNTEVDWVMPLLTGGLGAALSEEIVFRGVIFRISEEGLGTGWALAISGLLFGAVHLSNPGATLWSGAAIAIEAGLLLGLVYHLWRSLWVCTGVHMGWNVAQGTLWGVPVSGHRDDALLVSSRPGPEWLTGGAWGAEASVIAVILNLALALGLLALAMRRNTLVPLPSRRRPMMPASTSSMGAPC